jgi:hypothetical protein
MEQLLLRSMQAVGAQVGLAAYWAHHEIASSSKKAPAEAGAIDLRTV